MKNTLENFQALLLDEIKSFNEMQLIRLNNAYAGEIQNNYDNAIFENDCENLELLFECKDAYYILCSGFYGDYKPGDNFITLNGYGNLESFNLMTIDKLCELPQTMVIDIVENFEYFSDLFSDEAFEIYREIDYNF